MIVFPNAKINLGLKIIEKRKDGYHNLETCFYPVMWQDALEIIEAPKTGFSSTGLNIPGQPNDNLCLRAYKLLSKDYHLPPVSIHLHKEIPIGAGLGGGSSNASFTLKALNELFNIFLDPVILEQYAAQIGSDCPFFIENKPVVATGTGDVFAQIDLDLSGTCIAVIFPRVHVSTANAFAKVVPSHSKINLKEVLESVPPEEWKKYLKNDFETGVFERIPKVAKLKDYLYSKGAYYSSMSGSGAAVYGLFKEKAVFEPEVYNDNTIWQGLL